MERPKTGLYLTLNGHVFSKRDFICNWWGNNQWVLDLEWSGKSEYNAEPLRPWYASEKDVEKDEQAGIYRASGNLAFAVVDNAGHFVRSKRATEAVRERCD